MNAAFDDLGTALLILLAALTVVMFGKDRWW